MPKNDEDATLPAGTSHDVFLSYNREDREAVEKIAIYLEDQLGLKSWFDYWTLVPGESRLRNLYRGLEVSHCCAVFIGQRGDGPWERPEVMEALRSQGERGNYRLIPVMLPDAPTRPELPEFFSNTTWVDLRRGVDDEEALWRLECGIRGVSPGRGRQKPPPNPAFKEQAGHTAALITPQVSVPRAAQSVTVFVSYRHQDPDQSVAHALAEALGRAGHEVFIDTGIRWGADWAKEINRYLEKAHYFLLLLSEDSAASEMVVEELIIARELARKKGTPIILPLRVSLPFDAPLPYQVSAYLRSIQQEQWSQPDDTTRVIERLLDVIAEKARWAAEQSVAAARTTQRSTLLQPQADPREMIEPGGALDADSRYYILRQADDEVYEQITLNRGLVTIRGPHQTGKTSLMMSTYAAIRVGGEALRAAFIDFQSFSLRDLRTLSSMWRAVAKHIARQLGLGAHCVEHWKPGMDHDEGFELFLERCIFAEDERPLLICLDEIDRIFRSPIKDEFFSTLRAFYNDGARDRNWRRVRWLLGTSSEPSFFIEDLGQSPFNVGQRVNLDAFTPAETEALARRRGLEPTPAMLERVMAYLGGRPYLVHLLFYRLARQSDTVEQLFDARTAGGGVFRDHLHRYLMHFHRDAALAEAMRHVTLGEGCEDARLADRLEAGGLAKRDESDRLVPQCGLYADFFRKELRADG